MEFQVVSLILAFLLLLYYWWSTRKSYWKRRNVPHLKPTPYFGNLLPFILKKENYHQTLYRWYNSVPDEYSYVGTFQLMEPVLLIKDPALVVDITIKNFSHFVDRDINWIFRPENKKLNPLSDNIFATRGDRWKLLRTKLSPVFTSGKLKKVMFKQIVTCAELMAASMENNLPEMDIEQVFVKYTIDTIGTCAFGVDIKSLEDPNSKFVLMAKKSFLNQYNLRFAIISIHEKLLDYLRIGDLSSDVTKFFTQLVYDAIQYREQHKVKRNDALDMLIDIKKNEFENKNGDDFNDADIAAIVFLFFAAGFESTASALRFCIYELALNSDIQQKVRDELNDAMNSGEFNIDVLQKLKYMDMVISETLRKYPSLPALFRVCTEPYIIPNTKTRIDKGTRVLIPTLPFHRDPKYFPDPDTFDPNRFSDVNKNNIEKGTYFPFGEGPRFCIGVRLAMMQLKIALVHVLTNFEVMSCDKTEVPPTFKNGLPLFVTRHGTWLKLRKLN